MLPSAHRLSDGASFREAVRTGRRAGARTVVVHLAVPAVGPTVPGARADAAGAGARVGLVVSKAVGNAVVRNRVKRRLRHLAREHVAALPDAAVLVLRAQPAAATASYADLRADLTRALERVVTADGRTR